MSNEEFEKHMMNRNGKRFLIFSGTFIELEQQMEQFPDYEPFSNLTFTDIRWVSIGTGSAEWPHFSVIMKRKEDVK
jgi:hypothetical protein